MAATLNQFLFFDKNSSSTDSNIFGNSEGASSLTIQFTSDNDFDPITVMGAVDLKDPESFYTLKVVSLETFKKTTEVSKPGVYLVVTSGVSLIKLHRDSGSDVKAFAVAIA